MKMILASNNQKKLLEMQALLADLGVELVTQRAAGCDFEVDETGTSFEENAWLKAAAVTRATGQVAIADDSGLAVDALDGAPGIYSARFTGNHSDSDADRNAYLLEKLAGVSDRSGRFVCAICCTFPNGDVIRTRGECPGHITTAPSGSGGFGYDPVFWPDGADCTMAELSPEEKNRLGHRGKAIRELKERLKEYYADK